MLVGLGLLAVTMVARLWMGSGVITVLVPLFRDVGVALLVAAVWLGLRKLGTNARPFLTFGVGRFGDCGSAVQRLPTVA